MAESILVQVKVDKKTKQTADNLFFEMGLDTTTAIRMFLKRCIMHGGIPFDVILENNSNGYFCDCGYYHKPNKKTLEAMKEAEEIEKNPQKYKSYSSFSEILEEIENE